MILHAARAGSSGVIAISPDALPVILATTVLRRKNTLRVRTVTFAAFHPGKVEAVYFCICLKDY